MTRGKVMGHRPMLPVTFRLAGGLAVTIEFQKDTGFTEYLTLPAEAVTTMALPFLRPVRTVLADGNYTEMALHVATIVWDDVDFAVPVLATGRRPLLGAALLDGHELRVRYAEGDAVTIEALAL